jgi:hypothetical protein
LVKAKAAEGKALADQILAGGTLKASAVAEALRASLA